MSPDSRPDLAASWRQAEARRRSIYAAGGLDALLAAGEISPAVVACLRVLVLCLLPFAALAHTAPSGWEYDRECCDMRDCAQVPDHAVSEVQGGYRVTLLPGEHPMGAGEWTVRHGDPRIRPSGDEHRHVCHMHGRLLCLYTRAGGV